MIYSAVKLLPVDLRMSYPTPPSREVLRLVRLAVEQPPAQGGNICGAGQHCARFHSVVQYSNLKSWIVLKTKLVQTARVCGASGFPALGPLGLPRLVRGPSREH